MGIVTNIRLLNQRRTKILATLGPASSDPAMIRRLILAGANVIRLNMSHGDQASHAQCYHHVRAIAADLTVPLAIVADLCGPKIRVGKFPDGEIALVNGSEVVVTTRDVLGGPKLIPSLYPDLANDVTAHDRILLNDGDLELLVQHIAGTEILCTVVRGGTLKNNKGMNLPQVNISSPSFTAKDREDALFALDLGVDFLALSFVRKAGDIQALRDLIRGHGSDAGIIAKIEKPEALEQASVILDLSDAGRAGISELSLTWSKCRSRRISSSRAPAPRIAP